MHIPYPGLRIIKTTLSIFICLGLSYLFQYPLPLYATLACVLVMKSTPEQTVQVGLNRMIGTIFGGCMAGLSLEILSFTSITYQSFWYILCITLVIFINLYFCKLFKFKEYACSMSCVLILVVMISENLISKGPMLYVLTRTIETIAGIVVAVVINKYLNLPKKQ